MSGKLVQTGRPVRPTFEEARALFESHHHRGNADLIHFRSLMKELDGLFDVDLVDSDEIVSVHERTRSTIWLVENEGRFEGVNLFIPLSRIGVESVLAGTFSPRAPTPECTIGCDAPLHGIYHWGFAGLTKSARRYIMQLSAAFVKDVGPYVYLFGRGATNEGVAAARSLGMKPVENPIDRLFMSRPECPVGFWEAA